MIKLRVSNIDTSVSKHDLERLFGEFGGVDSVKLFRTPGSGKSLAFVIMFEELEGLEAMEELNGDNFMGSKLSVEESRDKIVKKDVSPRPKTKRIDLDDDDDDDDDPIEKEMITKNTYKGSVDDLRETNSEKWALLKKKAHDKEVGREEYSYGDAPDPNDLDD